MYELKLDNILNENDKSFVDNGVMVVVDKKSFLYLVGTTLDFSGGLNGKGFIFSNPNADRPADAEKVSLYKINKCHILKKELKEELDNKTYEFGFVTDIESEKAPNGLNEDIIKLISSKKREPEWLLNYRLEGF